MAPLRVASSSSALCLNCNLCLYSGNTQKESLRKTGNSLFKLILAATYSPTNTLRSTIGEGGLNCRVRHGTGCVPSSVTTRNLYVLGCDLRCQDPRLCTCFLMRRPILSHLIDFGSDPKIQSHDFGLDLDAERMKHDGGESEGVYVIRRGCADDCFAVMRQI